MVLTVGDNVNVFVRADMFILSSLLGVKSGRQVKNHFIWKMTKIKIKNDKAKTFLHAKGGKSA